MSEPQVQLNAYVQELSRTLLPQLDQLAAELAERVMSIDVLYRDERLVPLDDLRRSCRNNLELGFTRLAGEPTEGQEAPRETGRRRAEQGIPLPSALRAYRIGGRFIWDVLLRNAGDGSSAKEALLRASGEVWTIIDDYSETVGDGFREAVSEQARRDTQVRTALLNGLLDGSLGDGPRLRDAATALNLPQQGDFVVVAAETPQAGDQSLLRMEESLGRRAIVSAWRLDAEQQTGIVCLSGRFTVDVLCRQVAVVAPARVGVSTVYKSLPGTPEALRQARIACSSAGYRTRAVARYDTEPIAVLLASAPAAGTALAHSVLGSVLELQHADRDLLLDTLRGWLAGHGSASTAAAELHVHRNTVRYRLRRVEAMTNCELTDPIAVGRLHLALESIRIFGVDQIAAAGPAGRSMGRSG